MFLSKNVVLVKDCHAAYFLWGKPYLPRESKSTQRQFSRPTYTQVWIPSQNLLLSKAFFDFAKNPYVYNFYLLSSFLLFGFCSITKSFSLRGKLFCLGKEKQSFSFIEHLCNFLMKQASMIHIIGESRCQMG